MIALTPDELFEITRKRRYSAQCRALAEMGIPFKHRPDGSPFVRRDYESLARPKAADSVRLNL